VAFLERWGTDSLAPSARRWRIPAKPSSRCHDGVFEVADPDAEAIRRTLSDAGVESLHYFGSWTYT
jgi:hypothetical protein